MSSNKVECNALDQKVPYENRRDEREKFQIAGMPWWTNGKANIILVPIFSAMDGIVLLSIFDECFTQSLIMSIVMAFGIAVVLNILPLIIARFVHAAFDKTERNAVLMMCIFIAGFVLIYAGTVYLRFAYSDMYGQDNQMLALENTVSDESIDLSSDGSEASNNRGDAVVLLLSISPLITSLLGFGIAYVCDDEIAKKVNKLELQKREIDEKIAFTEAAIVQIESILNSGPDKFLELDKTAMDVAIEETVARCDILKSLARLYLSEYLANPSATSKISQEMLVETGDKGNDTCEVVVKDEHMSNPNDNINTVDNVA